MVRFIKENSVGIFMSRIAVQEDGAGGGDVGVGDGNGGTVVSAPEDAMMGRMGILVVCRFERLLVEEQVSEDPSSVCSKHRSTYIHTYVHTYIQHTCVQPVFAGSQSAIVNKQRSISRRFYAWAKKMQLRRFKGWLLSIQPSKSLFAG